jgi:hypothetical protein
MKEYKFLQTSDPNDMTRQVNNLTKIGWIVDHSSYHFYGVGSGVWCLQHAIMLYREINKGENN